MNGDYLKTNKYLINSFGFLQSRWKAFLNLGEMAEWFMASVLKTDIVFKLSRVRIPLSPFSIFEKI